MGQTESRDYDEREVIPPREGLPGRGRAGEYAERQCARVIAGMLGGPDERICGKPASVHIAWESTPTGLESGWACAAHALEIADPSKTWRALDMHGVGPDCGMPGSRWVHGDPSCCESNEIPLTAEREAVVAVGSLVGVS